METSKMFANTNGRPQNVDDEKKCNKMNDLVGWWTDSVPYKFRSKMFITYKQWLIILFVTVIVSTISNVCPFVSSATPSPSSTTTSGSIINPEKLKQFHQHHNLQTTNDLQASNKFKTKTNPAKDPNDHQPKEKTTTKTRIDNLQQTQKNNATSVSTTTIKTTANTIDVHNFNYSKTPPTLTPPTLVPPSPTITTTTLDSMYFVPKNMDQTTSTTTTTTKVFSTRIPKPMPTSVFRQTPPPPPTSARRANISTDDNNNNNNNNNESSKNIESIYNNGSMKTATKIHSIFDQKQELNSTNAIQSATTTTTTAATITKSIDPVLSGIPPSSSNHHSHRFQPQHSDDYNNNNNNKSVNLIGRNVCEYGTIRKYVVNTVVHWRLSSPISIKATIVLKCLNQLTWGDSFNEASRDDQLNGQKYLALIGDFRIGPSMVQNDLGTTFDSIINDNSNANMMDDGEDMVDAPKMIKRSKRGIYRYIEHLWKDFKYLLVSKDQDQTSLPRDSFDVDMIESMENEIENNRKCHYDIPNKYWDLGPTSKKFYLYGSNGGAGAVGGPGSNVPGGDPGVVANPFAKMSLPFWFIQLDDGSIPQIRFCKQETNVDIKNWKKYIISLFVWRLNTTDSPTIEKSWMGTHPAWYQIIGNNISTMQNNNYPTTIQISKHIQFDQELNFEPNEDNFQTENHHELNSERVNYKEEEGGDIRPSTMIELNQTFTFHKIQSTILDSAGNASIKFDYQNEMVAYLEGTCHFDLKMFPKFAKHEDTMKLLSERFIENSKETLVAQMNKRETILFDKYTKLLDWMRSKLGRNEYRYYTTLYESATSRLNSQEHDALLELITLEQQLNHTVHAHNSIIGDIRRIGTAHNIQLVCGVNMVQIVQNEKCYAFVLLLLKSSSKTAQRDLLYALQNAYNSNNNQSRTEENHKLTIGSLVGRLISHTNKPTRWFIENLLHETFRQTSQDRQFETLLLQALTLLTQNEQLLKLREMLSVHIVKRIGEIIAKIDQDNGQAKSNSINELLLVDLIKMLANLDNYTAIESVHRRLLSSSFSASSSFSSSSSPSSRLMESTFLTIATIHAYRRSINRSQVQNYLGELFQQSNSTCQIKQEIVQLLIDNVDMIFLEQSQDKRWPKYGFNWLDGILAQNLRNSSNNCVHHLIIEYFKRKINYKSKNYIRDYENQQNYDSSSFDFCINESKQVKCDYVQKVGTDMVSLSIRKSISTTKFANNAGRPVHSSTINNTTGDQARGNRFSSSSASYTKYSIDLNLLKNRLTLGHLNVIQSGGGGGDDENPRRLHIELDSYRGQTITVASLNVQELVGIDQRTNGTNTGEMAQVKINIPEIIVWSKRYLHYDYSLLVQVNLLISLKMIPKINNNHHNDDDDGGTRGNITVHQSQPNSMHAKHQLKINFDIKSNAEMLITSLVSKSSIELNSRFKYESLQPIEYGDHGDQRSSIIGLNEAGVDSSTSSSSSSSDAFQYLGSEWFHHEIELFREFNKRYDPRCNTWIDESYRQTLSLWNSTLVQKNILSLS